MDLPPLLNLGSKEEYREHYLRTLVDGPPVITPDGVKIIFYAEKFDYLFSGYSSKWLTKKDTFDIERAKRMDWIRALLESNQVDTRAEIMSAWETRRNVIDYQNCYMIVTKPIRTGVEVIKTAFPCTQAKAAEVRARPRWK
jgi:hypothetical protein